MGRWILSGVAVLTATGGFLADWNRTHLFNPRWTPHSKFHDGWTILLGAGTGLTSLQMLWRNPPETRDAALLAAMFWAAQGGAYLFPGAAGIAREIPDWRDRAGLARLPEAPVSAGMLALIWIGYRLASAASGTQSSHTIT